VKAELKEDTTLQKQARTAQARLEELRQRAGILPTQQELLPETLEELSIALAELEVAVEQLRQTNDELAESQQTVEAERRRYQELFDSAPDGYVVTDALGTILEANQAAMVLLNLTRDFLIGKPLALFVANEDKRKFRELLTRLGNGDNAEVWEGDIRPRLGRSPFSSVMTVSTICDVQGGLVGLRWIIRDITERKGAEEQIRSSLQRITALRDINLAITSTLDLQKVLELLLERIERFFPYPTATTIKLLNQETRELEYLACGNIDEAEWKAHRVVLPNIRLQQVIESKAPLLVRNVQADPRSLWPEFFVRNGLVSYLAIPLMIKEEVIGILCLYTMQEYEFNQEEIEFLSSLAAQAAIAIHNSRLYEQLKNQAAELRRARDELEERVQERTLELVNVNEVLKTEIAERKEIGEKLRESERQLQRVAKELEQQLIVSDRLVSLGELSASLAHEFNNPLQIILGFAEDLLREMEPSDPEYQPLAIIAQETERCRKIVQDLRDFARPTVAELRLTDLNDVLYHSIGLVSGHLRKASVQIKTEIQPGLPMINVDLQQLAQVLMNLFFNAAEAMPEGGTLTVRLTTNSADPANKPKDNRASVHEVIIAVADTGIGINPDNLSMIFHPFFTTKKKKGMGLGLSICDRIVKAHRGRIRVESTVDKGTTFYLYLPVEA
jgi:PAS domain S-box-containing protein